MNAQYINKIMYCAQHCKKINKRSDQQSVDLSEKTGENRSGTAKTFSDICDYIIVLAFCNIKNEAICAI